MNRQPNPQEISEAQSRHINDWQVDAQLGTGAFGEVYRVRHVDTGREGGALKLFDEDLEVGGCLTELELLFDADHPNIVDILSFGYTSGRKYIVYEYVEGGNLRDLLVSANRVDPEIALRILREAARGVAFAHDQSIVHRDLKPENMLLTEPSWPLTVKICDFGLSARACRDQQMNESYGSPAYMAPEQLEGDYDHRADLYAFGVMLHEMLFGRRPLIGDVSSIAHAHAHVAVPLPDSGSPELRRILDRTLASDPSERYPRADAMIEDMETAIDRLEASETAPRVEEPTSEQLAFERRWTASMTGHLTGRDGTRDGTLLLAVHGRLVSLTPDGDPEERTSLSGGVSEILAGGDSRGTIGWRNRDQITLLSDGERHEWSLDEEVVDGVYDALIGPRGQMVAVRTGEFVQLHELDGTIRWRASVDTYGMLPGLCFSDDGERVWISSEAPRTQIYGVSRDGEVQIRTSAPAHDISLIGSSTEAVWILCQSEERLCRMHVDGFIEEEMELFHTPTTVHAMSSSHVAVSSAKHLELFRSRPLQSRALVRYPAPAQPVVVGDGGIFQTSQEEGCTFVQYWDLQPIGS